MIELSIVTGTYNRLPFLKRFLSSVRQSLGARYEYEIVLVDGGSTDGTLDFCRTQRDVVLIEQGKLLGAIAAFNAGFAAAKGRYVIIANDDVEFIGHSIAVSLTFMDSHPHIGIGCFLQDRNHKDFHIEVTGAHMKDGKSLALPYGQVCIIPKWLGDQAEWWTLPGARTYGGDNALSARVWELGYPIMAIPNAFIHDLTPEDDLRQINNPVPVGKDMSHPDTVAYQKLWPRGPEYPERFKIRDIGNRPMRILYAPIYERGNEVQHQQKKGLRLALQKIGLVWEVDWVAGQSIVDAARAWRPDLALTQLHSGADMTPYTAGELRRLCGKLVNWNGDVYDRSVDEGYIAVLRSFDLQLIVNASAIPNYEKRGVKAAYWQIGYEPDGVGADPVDEKVDVILQGNGYSNPRLALGRYLKKLPYHVTIIGDQWLDGLARTSTLYDFKAGCSWYNAAKIAVGDSQWGSEAKGFVSNRLFQAMAAGGALVCHQEFPGMEEYLKLRDGVHLRTWKNNADLKWLIEYYLDPAHEHERRSIAAAGQREVLRHHSFDVRVKQLRAMLYPDVEKVNTDPLLANFHEEKV